MRIKIIKYGTKFAVVPVDMPGSPRIGVGQTMDAALGDFLRTYQKELGITQIDLDDASKKTENRRRQREFRKR